LSLDAGDVPSLFGEDQARYLLAVATENLEGLRAAAGEDAVPFAVVGRVGGPDLNLGGDAAPMADLVASWRKAFARELA
jgi:phosphoribosylformylglycinamidine synthase